MADLIKKIKIKKQDGTFTDYIPIGAEASNVNTEDGLSVENKLKKKNRFQLVVTELWLENEEFIFTFNGLKCGNGEFKVYSIGD